MILKNDSGIVYFYYKKDLSSQEINLNLLITDLGISIYLDATRPIAVVNGPFSVRTNDPVVSTISVIPTRKNDCLIGGDYRLGLLDGAKIKHDGKGNNLRIELSQNVLTDSSLIC